MCSVLFLLSTTCTRSTLSSTDNHAYLYVKRFLLPLLDCHANSVAEESYDKQVALVQAEQSEVRLRRLGEVELLHQEWKANNEMVRIGWEWE